MSEQPTILADGVLEAHLAHGVVRLTLGQNGPDGKPVACGRLAIPLGQLPVVANALVTLLRQIEQKAREGRAAQEAQDGGPAAPAAGAAPVPAPAPGDASGPDAMPAAFHFR